VSEEIRGEQVRGIGGQSIITTDPYSMFLFALRSPKTRAKCTGRLRMFFDFTGIPGDSMVERSKVFCDRAKNDDNYNCSGWAFSCIIGYIQHQKERAERKEITAGTVKNYFQVIKLFCEMSDISLPWKRISRGLPKSRKFADDRAPTIEEISKMLDYPDRRLKAIIYTMASSGIRVGAWDYLKWKHVIPIQKNGQVIAAKLLVYAGETDEYFTFISPEAYHELEKWKEYRIQSGESVDFNGWVMRNIWNTKKGYTRGLVSAPIKLKSEGVKRLVEDALWTQGLRKKLDSKKRHEFQTDHGFRKWFKTRCELAGMKPINIEILMNHSTGISDSYYRATEAELLEDYMKAIDSLTINNQNRLQNQVAILNDKSREQGIDIQTKLYQRDNDIAELKAAVAFLADKVNAAIITNEPSSKVIFNQQGIATGIEITSVNNTATAPLAKITEEYQESDTITGT
jgi:integrase